MTHVRVPVSQSAPGAQSALEEQFVPQAPVDTQRYGAHSVTVPSLAVEERKSFAHVATIATHTPCSQAYPSVQCSLRAHAVRQPASSQPYGVQLMGLGVEQVPAPSQVPLPA